MVLNGTGAVLSRQSFAAYGTRRNATTWNGAPTPTEWQAVADTTRRGFTGHEHLDNVMLIHMNGRVFDPVVGRFLSADPYVDCLQSMQSWNRFAYVQGRALSAIDPSGFTPMRMMRMDEALPSDLERIIVEATWLNPTGDTTLNFGVSRVVAQPPEQRGGGGSSRTDRAEAKSSEDCASTCQSIAAISLGLGTAVTGGITGFQTGQPLAGVLGALGGGIAGATVGAFGSGGEYEPLFTGAALGAASEIAMPGISAFAGASIGAAVQYESSKLGLPTSIGTVASGGLAGAAASGFSAWRAGAKWAKIAITARKGGLAGLAGGAVTAAISSYLQSKTGCDCDG